MAARKRRSRKGKSKRRTTSKSTLTTAQLSKRVRRLELLTGHTVKRKRKARSHDQIIMHGIGI
jgi:hypothetical protein